ncbi:MAG: flagellar export protein FliJ [Gemmatirosa sp.]
MFRFRLQRVLDLRARTERDAASALVSAQEVADAARDAQLRLEQQRAELAAAQRRPETEGTPVGALRNLSFLLERMDEQVAGAAQVTAAADGTVQQREDALRAAFRDRRTLDRLREKHQDAWRAGEVAQDRALMDEIALTRFTTQGSAGSTGRASHASDES